MSTSKVSFNPVHRLVHGHIIVKIVGRDNFNMADCSIGNIRLMHLLRNSLHALNMQVHFQTGVKAAFSRPTTGQLNAQETGNSHGNCDTVLDAGQQGVLITELAFESSSHADSDECKEANDTNTVSSKHK